MYTVLLVVHILLAIAIVALVLMQRSDNDGFGLSGGGNSMFSSRATANFLTRSTAVLTTCFFLTSLGMAWLISHRNDTSIVDQIDAGVAPVSHAIPSKTDAGEAPADANIPAKNNIPVDTAPAAEPEAPAVPLAN